MKIGYVRVSEHEQHEALHAASWKPSQTGCHLSGTRNGMSSHLLIHEG